VILYEFSIKKKKEMTNLAVLSNEELKNIDGGVVPLAIAGVAGFTKVAGAITAGAGVVGAGYGRWKMGW
jgi:lactobin A/cerein 7B family class IIb bacteriocin